MICAADRITPADTLTAMITSTEHQSVANDLRITCIGEVRISIFYFVSFRFILFYFKILHYIVPSRHHQDNHDCHSSAVIGFCTCFSGLRPARSLIKIFPPSATNGDQVKDSDIGQTRYRDCSLLVARSLPTTQLVRGQRKISGLSKKIRVAVYQVFVTPEYSLSKSRRLNGINQ